jgi:hypothetical protein
MLDRVLGQPAQPMKGSGSSNSGAYAGDALTGQAVGVVNSAEGAVNMELGGVAEYFQPISGSTGFFLGMGGPCLTAVRCRQRVREDLSRELASTSGYP